MKELGVLSRCGVRPFRPSRHQKAICRKLQREDLVSPMRVFSQLNGRARRDYVFLTEAGRQVLELEAMCGRCPPPKPLPSKIKLPDGNAVQVGTYVHRQVQAQPMAELRKTLDTLVGDLEKFGFVATS